MIEIEKLKRIRSGELDKELFDLVLSNQMGADFLDRLKTYYNAAKQKETFSGKEGLAFSTLFQIYISGRITYGEFIDVRNSYIDKQIKDFTFSVNGNEKALKGCLYGEENYENERLIYSDLYDASIDVREYSQDGTFQEIHYDLLSGKEEIINDSEDLCKAAKILSDDKRIEVFMHLDRKFQIYFYENIFERGKLVKKYLYKVIDSI